ncbi:DUF6069 family protein [Streptomyces sp. NPDC005498]|uniref:DUF6069 family protein n=1 Tax=Streptomyces sp. NPDC005498 TaxID=3364717 RepID=UPI0036C4E121
MAGPAPFGGLPDSPATGSGFRPPAQPRSVGSGRLWATGAATAVVAALVAVVATTLVRGVLGIPLFAPHRAGAWGDITTGNLAGWAVAGALAATGLLHLLLLTVAQPRAFFSWIAGLVTGALALLPFTTTLGMDEKLASAGVFLAIGATITGLLATTAYSVVSFPDREGW